MPAGRPPNPLTPDASLAHAVGAQIRALREEAGLTLEGVGRRAGYTPQHVSAAEQATSTLSLAFLEAIDVALCANGAVASQHEALVVEHAGKKAAAATLGDVRRKMFLALGFAAVLWPDTAARGLAEADAEQVAYEWGRELFLAPDRQALLPGIAADLRRMTDGPSRPVAWLATYVAMIAALGRQRVAVA